MRDVDKGRVYEAEDFVFQGTLFAELVTDRDITELADELFASDWWVQNKIPVPEIQLQRLDAPASMAYAYNPVSGRPPEIRFTYEQVNPWTLAHEAAHIAQYHLCQYPHVPVEGHGPEFRRAYYTVTEILCGQKAAQDLGMSFATRLPPRTPLRDPAFPPNPSRDTEGIFPRWRTRKQVEALNAFKPAHDPLRINGAIAL